MKFKYYLRGAGFGVITATVVLSVAFLFQDTLTDAEIIERASKLGMVMQEGGTAGMLADVSKEGASAADLENTGSKPEGTQKGDAAVPGQETGKEGSAKGSSTASEGGKPASGQSSAQSADEGKDLDSKAGSGKTGTSGNEKDTSGSNKTSTSGNEKDTPNSGNDAPDANKAGTSNPAKGQQASSQGTSGGGTSQGASGGLEASGKNTDGAGDKPNPAGQGQAAADGKVEITIESGDVSRIVSSKVKEAGLVEDAADFNAYLGAHGYDNLLQPGTYEIEKGASFSQIAQILTSR